MSRQPWTEAEVADLSLSWAAFSARHPSRSYDSYEVKRRRIRGGSAGSRLVTRAERVLTLRAIEGLKALTEFVEAQAR